MTSPAQTIDELVLPLVTAAALELWDVEVTPRLVRVLVDRPGGIDLDRVAEVARVISAALDEREDLTPSRNYQLEVGSPGVERTLRTPSHFQRYVGARVAVKTAEAVAGTRRLQGVLRAADDTGITLEPDPRAADSDDVDSDDAGSDDGVTVLSYPQIQKARTVLVWGPAAKSPAGATKARAATGAPRGAAAAAKGRPERMKDVAR